VSRRDLVEGAPLAGDRAAWTRPVHEKIRQRYLQTTARSPDAAGTATPDGARWLDQAWQALSRGDFAWAYAAGLCHTQEETAQGAVVRARAAAGLGRLDEAVLEAQRAVRLAPEEPDNHLTLAGVFADLGNVPAALRSYRTAQRLAPGSAAASVGHALAVARSGDARAAEQILESLYAVGTDRQMIGDCLGLVLVDAAEQVPRVRAGERYVITTPAEITAMRTKLDRAAVVAVDADVRACLDEVRSYVDACARRTWSGPRLPVPRWKLNRRACEREEWHGPP
jgi:tetratricopeptide (TPR) repeat protein